MAMSANDAFATGGGRGRRRRGRRGRGALSEINVTPLVDVMLVLLIVFMISAPLLTAGVPLELPKTDASAVDASDDPVVISIKRDGAIYVGEREVSFDRLVLTVAEEGGAGARDKAVSVRGDGRAPYQAVARVMARLSSAGFTKLNLITDTAGGAPTDEEG
jgi:biopolymer transport protein TolR